MNPTRSFPFFAVAFWALFSLHCPEAAEKKSKRPPPVTSPAIHEDGSVTFRIQAKNAKEVSVSGEMAKGKIDLTREDEGGTWSVTVDPVEPGLYGYSFSVDGMKTIDPGNRHLKPGRSPRTSILYIPGDHSYDFKDVPHGTVHSHEYFSKPIAPPPTRGDARWRSGGVEKANS